MPARAWCVCETARYTSSGPATPPQTLSNKGPDLGPASKAGRPWIPKTASVTQGSGDRARGAYRRCFGLISSLTVREWRPFRRRRARTLRPAFVFMRARKPWSFSLLRRLGFLNVGCILLSLVHRGSRPAHLTESL